jgi:serine-type D-Ala-D-Ala carboxypeptidase (penicillin-binding protein 5/6)
MIGRVSSRSPRSAKAAQRLFVLVTVLVLCSPTLTVRAATAAQPSEEWPRHAARAAVVMDADSGRLLFGERMHDRMQPASLTKMVTALVALERSALDRPIQPRRSYTVVPAIIGIGVADSLPLEEALYGLLLSSGNDVAVAIAETIGDGSVDRYVGWMQEFASRLGLADTRFLNPHGLDEAGHLSSAYDMAVVGRIVMRHPVLSKVVGTPRRLFEGPPRWLFVNTNPLLGTYRGLDGIKTGYDDLAGRCFVATAVRDGRRAIVVIMNSNRYAADATALLDAAFANGSWTDDGPVRESNSTPVARIRGDLPGPSSEPGAQSTYRASRERPVGAK